MLAMWIVYSLVLVTVIFQLELFILLNLSYHNVRSSHLAQHGELTGYGISDPWRIDFGNWQVDYSDPFSHCECFAILRPVMLVGVSTNSI